MNAPRTVPHASPRPRVPGACLLAPCRIAAALAVLTCAGCAIQYSSASRGVEKVWGLSQVAWRVESLTNGWATVRSGTSVPGLVLGVGPDFFGLSLGLARRERLLVVPAAEADAAEARLNGAVLESSTHRHWSLGATHFRTPGTARMAVVTGQAVAGLRASLESARPSLAVGLEARQSTAMTATNACVDLEQAAARWPAFDLTRATVRVETTTNPKESSP